MKCPEESDANRIDRFLAEHRERLAMIVERHRAACRAECKPTEQAIFNLERLRKRFAINADRALAREAYQAKQKEPPHDPR